MQEVFLSSEGILIFLIVSATIGIIYCFYKASLSNVADEKNLKSAVVIFIQNTQTEIEGFVRNYYNRKVGHERLWVVDCGSKDQTPQILERLSRKYPVKLIFLTDMSIVKCMQKALMYIDAQVMLFVNGIDLEYKDILKLVNQQYIEEKCQNRSKHL